MSYIKASVHLWMFFFFEHYLIQDIKITSEISELKYEEKSDQELPIGQLVLNRHPVKGSIFNFHSLSL
jgi:hypothetical protein